MPVQPFGQEIRELAQSVDKSAGAFGQQVSALAQAKKTQGDSTDASASVADSDLSITVGQTQNSLALVLKTAVEGINTALEPVFGADAVQPTRDAIVDATPVSTSESIVSPATSLFDSFRGANPEQELDTALNEFVAIIESGIETGFAEARDILEHLQVLDGEIATNVEATYQLVREKLTAFVENYSASNQPNTQSAGEILGTE